ncbi:MAG: hypothetical protein COY19_00010 [Candidatus Marinimicrobia bacterium CG_4_10_14_0_2_um_filter_48_9]|nr:MAG: hypothetical protein COY19_00010 [Candidatus Marinimicrobia bacterium CG_4_10_14_0_2_um_filter_48_9]PJA55052.1 MAG: hypothetical protein CO167_00390 [Candidatus Marinimicrobia bacterium CG_4_9_14_3_um_filter_48_9]
MKTTNTATQKKNRSDMRTQRGFTLMELIVSMSIMGTLAALAIPYYLEQQAQSKTVKTVDNLNTIASVIKVHYDSVVSRASGANPVPQVDASLSSAQDIKDSTAVITYEFNGSTHTVKFGDMFGKKPPVSPFGDQPYQIQSEQNASITFGQNAAGTVYITSFTPARIKIWDVQDSSLFNIKMKL